MMATMRPGSVAVAAAAVTWASTLPTHTGRPTGSPISAAISSVKSPALAPSPPMEPLSFSSAKEAKPALRAPRYDREG